MILPTPSSLSQQPGLFLLQCTQLCSNLFLISIAFGYCKGDTVQIRQFLFLKEKISPGYMSLCSHIKIKSSKGMATQLSKVCIFESNLGGNGSNLFLPSKAIHGEWGHRGCRAVKDTTGDQFAVRRAHLSHPGPTTEMFLLKCRCYG